MKTTVMKRSEQLDNTIKSSKKHEKTRNRNSFADSEMFNSSKGCRKMQTNLDLFQT